MLLLLVSGPGLFVVVDSADCTLEFGFAVDADLSWWPVEFQVSQYCFAGLTGVAFAVATGVAFVRTLGTHEVRSVIFVVFQRVF